MINEHVSPKECTGCTACKNICPVSCIEMKEDKEGFLQPVCDTEKCIKCGKCLSVCPVLNKEVPEQDTKCYAAYSLDEGIRKDSSSGGMFSLLAEEIIDQNGIVFGAAYDQQFHVRHIAVTKKEDLSKLRGAKYAQSLLGDTFLEVKEYLEKGTKVLFSGTPCQVSGLVHYLGKEYENLYTVDFVCHGVPSPKVWDEYVKYRAKTDDNGTYPVSINLRSKHTGWSKYQYSNLYTYPDGKQYSAKSGEDPFMKLFVGDSINRQSCAECPCKGYDRISDITLGDFWGIWYIDPSMDDNKGTSLLLIHTKKGKQLFEKIKGNARIQEVTKEQASAQNPSLIQSSPMNNNRKKQMMIVLTGVFEKPGKQESLFKKLLYRIKR